MGGWTRTAAARSKTPSRPSTGRLRQTWRATEVERPRLGANERPRPSDRGRGRHSWAKIATDYVRICVCSHRRESPLGRCGVLRHAPTNPFKHTYTRIHTDTLAHTRIHTRIHTHARTHTLTRRKMGRPTNRQKGR